MEVWCLSQRHFDRLSAEVQHTVRDKTGDFTVTRQLPKLLSSGFKEGFLQKLRGWKRVKHPLSSIPFVIWRSPHDHQTSVVFCLCTRGKSFHRQKKKEKKKRASPLYSSLGWERENTTLLLCLSQSHIRSDHWQIKALPDTSLPLSGGSWHALGTQHDRAVAEGMKKRNFFWQERNRETGGRERKLKGETELEEREWKYVVRQRWNLHTCGLDPQCRVVRGGGGGRAARNKEVRRH